MPSIPLPGGLVSVNNRILCDVMWFHFIFELDQAKPSGLDQDYLKYSDYAVVTGNPININFLEFLIFKQANGAKKSFNS